MQYIEIDKASIPYRFEIVLAEVVWQFEVRYNQEHDFFSVDLLKDDELIVAGEKIVYGRPLFSTFVAINKPAIDIIPLDLAGNATRAGWDELNETVFLYLVGEDNE